MSGNQLTGYTKLPEVPPAFCVMYVTDLSSITVYRYHSALQIQIHLLFTTAQEFATNMITFYRWGNVVQRGEETCPRVAHLLSGESELKSRESNSRIRSYRGRKTEDLKESKYQGNRCNLKVHFCFGIHLFSSISFVSYGIHNNDY